MITFEKNSQYSLISGMNLLLAFSAAALIIFIFSNLKDKHRPAPLARAAFKQLGLSDNTPLFSLGKAANFNDEIFKRKQLFNALSKKTGQEKSGFVLLGISVGNKNLAMIRNNAENKDYYCSEGDIVGDFTVKQILKDRVVLETQGNTLVITQ